MSVSYSQFLTEVTPFCPDVSEPQAINAIRNTCIEFCEKTTIWRVRGSTPGQAGRRMYNLAVELDTHRASVIHAYYGQQRLEAVGADELANMYSRDWQTVGGAPRYYVENPDDTITLVPFPDGEQLDTLSYELALTPTRESDEIGLDYVFERYVEVIAAGALQRIYMTMGQSYYSPELARMYGVKYLAGVSKAQGEVNVGNGRGRTRVRMRPFVSGVKSWR